MLKICPNLTIRHVKCNIKIRVRIPLVVAASVHDKFALLYDINVIIKTLMYVNE